MKALPGSTAPGGVTKNAPAGADGAVEDLFGGFDFGK